MRQTNTLIVGASMAGLASATALQKKGIDHIVIEKEAQIATPWRNHYDRLHLHTYKSLSTLPYKKFAHAIPRYPSRQQVIDYLDDYQREFDIHPIFNTRAISIKRENDYWITETDDGMFKSRYLIIATGPYSKPKAIRFNGDETFSGKILHSCAYKTGRDFQGQKVLVVGFGNSACEIAIDLYEQGGRPSMAVRSPVNVVPRDFLGIPILRISQWMSQLPPRLADTLNAPLMQLWFGDISGLGLKKKPYGAFEQIQKEGRIPLLDIGTIRHIRQGHIRIFGDIDRIAGKTVHFADGKRDDFDAIVAAIGYDPRYTGIGGIDQDRLEDLKLPVSRQKYFGKEGLYFCGFWIGPTGAIRELSLDAQKIARDIAGK
jgi:cation diffusion facilitator CzcD-associated flavoprotein CzcO